MKVLARIFGIWCLLITIVGTYLYITDEIFRNISGGCGTPLIIGIAFLSVIVCINIIISDTV